MVKQNGKISYICIGFLTGKRFYIKDITFSNFRNLNLKSHRIKQSYNQFEEYNNNSYKF